MKLLQWTTVVSLFLSLGVVASLANAQTLPPDLSSQVDKVFAKYDRPDSPGCALGIYQDGRIIYKHGYGMANLNDDVPITSATVFHVASMSKQFTAASILLLAQQSKLSLDDETGKRRRSAPSRRGADRLRNGFRRSVKDLLAIGTLLDVSLQARESGLADGLGPDQSKPRFRGAARHGRDVLMSVLELINSAKRRSPSLASRSTTRLWAACAAR